MRVDRMAWHGADRVTKPGTTALLPRFDEAVVRHRAVAFERYELVV